jgi:hypothetical protein
LIAFDKNRLPSRDIMPAVQAMLRARYLDLKVGPKGPGYVSLPKQGGQE